MAAFGPPGLTIQLWVDDGSAARAWYQRLFGRPRTSPPSATTHYPRAAECACLRSARAGWPPARLRPPAGLYERF